MSQTNPRIMSAVLRDATIDEALDVGRDFHKLYPGAYVVMVSDDIGKALFTKKL